MSSNSDRKVTITINDERHRLRAGEHSVADLKTLTKPPVDPKHSLWVDGDDSPDRELEGGASVEVADGMVIYSRGPDGAHPHHYDISIDKVWVVSENESVTGDQLRALADPPLPADRDLYRSIVGAPDEKIDGNEVVTLTDEAEFYSVPGTPRFVTIYVNTRPHKYEQERISYETVTKLAFPEGAAGSHPGFTVMYENGPGGRDGDLVAGQDVQAVDGMMFDVTRTALS